MIQGGDRRGDSGAQVSALRRAVERATDCTAYRVVDSERGFDVELRLDDPQWQEFFSRAGLRRTYQWKVTEKKSRYTIADVGVAVRWSAGVPGIGVSASKQGGRIFSFSRENIWAIGSDGQIHPVADYRFNSREGRDVIRLAAQQLGLTERLPRVLFWANVTIAVSGGIPALAFLSDWLLQR